MAMKELLYRMQPMQIYIVLALSIVYFLMQLFLSHITHSLTLLVASYHMLCNIVALSGCIVTIKQRHEPSLRNTFGWMRVEILTMLIAGIFLGAFCFSLVVEAVQTLIHIDHQDAMHRPVAILRLGVGGLILNLFCYLLIGGYTYHQGSFMHITSTGDVVLDQMGNDEGGLHRSEQYSSKTKHSGNGQSNGVIQCTGSSIQIDVPSSASVQSIPTTQFTLHRHSFRELMRDISSTLFVIICSIIVYFADNESVTKYVDPSISIVSGITLLMLSYPYMKESCLILLQTIPDSIDIEVFKADLLKRFDDIVNVHDLHIWQLTFSKYVSTVHILFHNPHVYVKIKDDVESFFHAQGITIVTIQPEFSTKSADNEKDSGSLKQCLIGCQSIECAPKTCCSTNDLDAILVGDEKKKKKKSKKSKYDRKSSSMVSLNVNSLAKLRKLTGSTQEIIKKSVSESHVTQICDDSMDSQNTSTNPSTAPSMANNLNAIDELKEKEFHEQCDERSEQRLPPTEPQSQPPKIESNAEHEDSSLLSRKTATEATPSTTQDQS
ncbi:proton-coupled zinc antiporter SLC30A1 [Sitodiplosis mosellana]|uniref:proton-coupled zinc antiporter SLC30A1 n=1 Tax=Sitodiplosis mosellana TaxID=263140 RepID=UPI002444861A|nr:proton-coupled zinc antiporter SLC30A1 [Sitodiplosis mosellana]XP_055312371.1 proton-coupled zinc antiporter SLC30A1 [Sitodiplosis mosellana]XP_055312372.1 proton-coupled zinc antiporter SLC30A1 [Sitodiplosis mosellana]XP_055312373.1 proton-coupled zinc antiporter SLC30A1 [Sitodiplosis mosellana]XP_055312374.1 proton-coupled zinc antiporter SLC30A1 [Sitodiplosis mosellana]XP_055312375.1 proton-coupled zinc antiporter SLC30A1 [Sitodiplosis mosellana]XP_055312376.1 proton-coupled zinc antipo